MESPEVPEVNKVLWRHLFDDHRRLDAILEDVRQLASCGSFAAAAKRFGEFRLAQERHIHAEENVLDRLNQSSERHPVVERVRQTHRQVLELLDELSHRLSRWEVDDFGTRIEALCKTLGAHEQDETVMFPALEQKLRDPKAYQRLLLHLARP
jgi:hypothetical protein